MTRFINLANRDIDTQYNLEGYDCYDANGEHVGDIDGVLADAQQMTPRYLVLDMGGWFNTKRYVVPIGEAGRVDDHEQRIYFRRLTKEMLKSGTFPEYSDEWLEHGDEARFSRFEQDYSRAYAPQTERTADTVDYTGELYRRPEQAGRLQLMEEHLQANKERYQSGAVKLGKRVTEHTETMEVPVTEERVVIERHPVSGEAPARGEIGADQTIEVPVMREKVNVEKQSVVREEVGVRKEAVQRQQSVQGTVRREELEVKDGQEHVTETSDTMAERQQRLATPEGPAPADASRTTTPRSTRPT
jgi:uncharacterized protein (TIGR02271 family)